MSFEMKKFVFKVLSGQANAFWNLLSALQFEFEFDWQIPASIIMQFQYFIINFDVTVNLLFHERE